MCALNTIVVGDLKFKQVSKKLPNSFNCTSCVVTLLSDVINFNLTGPENVEPRSSSHVIFLFIYYY